MLFQKSNKLTKAIKDKMQEYGILKFEKVYALRMSNGTKTKIKKLSQQEAETLFNELSIWTKQYVIDNIYKVVYDIYPSSFYETQSKRNDRLIQEFIVKGTGKDR